MRRVAGFMRRAAACRKWGLQRPYHGRLPHHAVSLLVVLVGNFVVAILMVSTPRVGSPAAAAH